MKKQDLSARQAAALRGSIRKWEMIVDGLIEDEGSDNCPLCQLYATQAAIETDTECRGCPVMTATGKNNCDDTPYSDWYWSSNDLGHATRMLDFLKSILEAAYVRQTKGGAR